MSVPIDPLSLITLPYYQAFISDDTPSKASNRYTLIAAASEAARNYTNNGLAASDRTDILDGRGANFLSLPAAPVNSVTSVTIGINEATPTAIAGSNFVWNANGTLAFAPQWPGSRIFTGGFQNISVGYNAGWTTLPSDLKIAVALIVQSLESLGSIDPNVISKSVRDVKVNYGAVLAQARAGDLSGPVFAGAAALLQRYVLTTCI